MKPRFVGRLGMADVVTVANAALGFVAAVAATLDIQIAARLILVGAIADGLDGVVARKRGSTPAGEYLDSMADVASFGVAPAAITAIAAIETWGRTDPLLLGIAVGVPAVYVAMAVTRLGLYTAYDVGHDETEGVQTTLAATVIAAAVLAGVGETSLLLAGIAVFAVLMVTTVTYPDLHAQDATVMGLIQALAVLVPDLWGRVFPFALLFLACGYLLLGPRFYWRDYLDWDGLG
ncbi:MAG: phosphatidylserine synthase [uncultured archaeon A07HR60]|nr:MAG: phosphatidylserine synthase [uncultured archaeon A07HR60]